MAAMADADDGIESWRVNVTGDAREVASGTPAWWFTGLTPREAPGFDAETETLTSLPLPRLDAYTREGLLEYFDNTWTLTEVLFTALNDESAYYRPPYHHLRHPLIFYYGHPAALYVNKLRVANIVEKPVNSYFENIFETGVDEMSWDDLSKNNMRWPTIREVHAYRREVYALVRDAILEHAAFDPSAGPITWGSDAWALVMGFEHERIHLETSSVLFRELPISLVRRPKHFPALHPTVAETARPAPDTAWTKVERGSVTLGKPRDFPSYGWDNEYGERNMDVPAFRITQHYVSNAHFLEFVKSGGYSTPRYWTQDGWKWRTFRNVKWPCFWVPDGPQGLHQYQIRMIFEVVPWNGALPAVVNAHESAAYTNWLNEKDGLPLHALTSYRLPSEAELARVRHAGAENFAHSTPSSSSADAKLPSNALVARDAVMHLSGQEFHRQLNQNTNLGFSSEAAVDASTPVMAPGPNGGPVYDIQGNVWQWCLDWFSALPGFRVHKHYDDFSTPCFDGQHSCIFGGSFISTGDEASVYARFHFRPHFYQHAGFRIARSEAAIEGSEVREIPLTHVDSPSPHAAGWNPRRTASMGITLKRMKRSKPDGEWEEMPEEAETAPAPAVRSGYASLSPERLLQLHYGSAADVVALLPALQGVVSDPFPTTLAQHAAAAAARAGAGTDRALEVGCSVGGGTFALAKLFGAVTGVDSEPACIAHAQRLQESGEARFSARTEGERAEHHAVTLDADKATRARTTFRVMDPCCLSPELGAFDLVVVNNVLSRVVSPKSVLGRMGSARGLVAVGGVCVVADTFDWQEELTPRDSWLGGLSDGEADSRAGVASCLRASGFAFLSESSVPLFVRASSRSASLSAVCVSAWRRVS